MRFPAENTERVNVILLCEESCLKAGRNAWWTWSGSNGRPLPCHGSALPAAPQSHIEGRCCNNFRPAILVSQTTKVKCSRTEANRGNTKKRCRVEAELPN